MKKAKEATVQYQTTTKKAASKPVAAAPTTAAPTAAASVTISADVLEQLQQAAEWKGISLEEAADKAVLDYFYQYAYEKVAQEQAVFEEMRSELVKKYRGQYVAVHNGKVVEHAADLSTLTRKVYARFGHTPMLRIQVTPEPLPNIRTHGLRLVREE
jgi:hypothetical protein